MRVLVFLLLSLMFSKTVYCNEINTISDEFKSENKIIVGDRTKATYKINALTKDKELEELEKDFLNCKVDTGDGSTGSTAKGYDEAINCMKDVAYRLFDTFYKENKKEMKETFDEYIRIASKISFNMNSGSDWGKHYKIASADFLESWGGYFWKVRELVEEYIKEIKFQQEDMHKALDDEWAQEFVSDISKL